jgi:hypothetical protein
MTGAGAGGGVLCGAGAGGAAGPEVLVTATWAAGADLVAPVDGPTSALLLALPHPASTSTVPVTIAAGSAGLTA